MGYKVSWVDHMVGPMQEIAERYTELLKKEVASPEAKGYSLILKGNDTKVTIFFFSSAGLLVRGVAEVSPFGYTHQSMLLWLQIKKANL